MEIEKKFRVSRLPGDLAGYKKKEIEQGYLCTEPVVRIRKSNEDYILTYKSAHRDEEKELDARMSEEVEVPLTREAYYHLREKTDHHLVAKTRYLVPLSGGFTGELDVFHGRLEGLCFIEVEFPDAEAAGNFVPPGWFGENVSSDERYTNSFLSCCDNLDVFQI